MFILYIILNINKINKVECLERFNLEYNFFYKDFIIFLSRKHDIFNTEITYSIANRAISIVEHRPE